jgi:alpha-mannosidase
MVMIKKKIEGELKYLCNNIYYNQKSIHGWKIKLSRYISPGKYEYTDNEWRDISVGEYWGSDDITAFLSNKIVLDESDIGKKVAFQIIVGGEGCVFINGIPFNGLDHHRNMVILTKCALGSENFEILIEAYAKSHGIWSGDSLEPRLIMSRIVCENTSVKDYYYFAKTIYDGACNYENDYMREYLFSIVYESLLKVKYESVDFNNSIIQAKEFLTLKINELSKDRIPMKMVLAGHSHIDVAWHWTLKETVRKCSRTFSTALRLMEQYPYFKFTQSTAQLYAYTKKFYPDLYKQIKYRISEGRWEAIGGMWVEPDCNLISGESFVRQILYGKKFFKEEFGIETKVCFLPDAFGFSGCMPQVLRKCGFQYFFTSKLAWNEINPFPYSVFKWEGIDGTRILSSMIEMDRNLYNGSVKIDKIKETLKDFKTKDGSADLLYLYGFGDGGGGVTPEMLETIGKLDYLPGMPEFETAFVEDYFLGLEEKNKNYPIWTGELYFEKHRGTYTTHSKNKKFNRKSEFLYRNVEILSAMGRVKNGTYSENMLDEGWRKLLLNQFHDILPGTSARGVYEDSLNDYEEIIRIGESVQAAQISRILIEPDGNNIITVFNTLSWNRIGIAEFQLAKEQLEVEVTDSEGNRVPSQITLDADGNRKVCFVASNLPSMGYTTYNLKYISEAKRDITKTNDSKDYMENDYFIIKFTDDGHVLNIFDKKNSREILKNGKEGNILQIFDDKPVMGLDAWCVDTKREDRGFEIPVTKSCKLLESGELFSKIRIGRTYNKSVFEQEILVYRHIPLIEFKNVVHWNEDHKMLRVLFPVEVHTTRATYDIAYGNVERPTHMSTPYEHAKFEVNAHKWADISEGGYGVALINDCKYGYSIIDGEMQLSLLRATTFPDPVADRGTHEFTYYLYPHSGEWKQAKVARLGYELNIPLICVGGNADLKGYSFMKIDVENVIIDCVKKAEDSNDIIVRMFEFHNQRGNINLQLGFEVKEAWECDLLENNLNKLQVENNQIGVYFKPYEIITIRLKL